MGFDLKNYETVKSRKKRFHTDHEDGRIIVDLIETDYLTHVIIKTSVYKTAEDQREGLPWGTGYAHEIRDIELKTTGSGKQYESINYASWLENCEESSVGRALDQCGYAGTCSREEMDKAGRMTNTIKKDQARDTFGFCPCKGRLIASAKGWIYCENKYKAAKCAQFAGRERGPDEKPIPPEMTADEWMKKEASDKIKAHFPPGANTNFKPQDIPF